MAMLGLFKVTDITRATLVVSNMSQQEILNKISYVTDQSTNTGFLPKGKKFHGIIGVDNFRLKQLPSLKNEAFLIKGVVKAANEKFVLHLEFVRGPVHTVLPTFFFIVVGAAVIQSLANQILDWRYLPFLGVAALLFLIAFDAKKNIEIKNIKQLFIDILK